MEIIRYAPTVELLRDEKGGRKIRGLASCYYNGTADTEYQIGDNLWERIQRGAWAERLQDDVFARVNHDEKQQVGRTPKSLSLWETTRGLEYEITLPNTSKANDLWEECQNEMIRGSSFRAQLNPDADVEYKREGDRRIMVIKRFEKLIDVAPVYKSAYPATEATAIMRCWEDYELRQRTERAHGLCKKLREKSI